VGRVYRRNGHWYLDYRDRTGRRMRRMIPDAEARTQREAKELPAGLEADELRVAKLAFGRGLGTRESLGAEASAQRYCRTGT
jgi:hypothetical protein